MSNAGDDSSTYVHRGDPFATPAGDRSPARRLRGRLAAGVTIWTAAESGVPAGLTMSSVLVADGSPAQMLGLINDTSALFDAIASSGVFVAHIAAESDGLLADVFAGIRPNPGGPFAGLDVDRTDWGPAIRSLPDRCFCRLVDTTEVGYHQLVRADIEKVELSEFDAPLVYFRGRYRKLQPKGDD